MIHSGGNRREQSKPIPKVHLVLPSSALMLLKFDVRTKIWKINKFRKDAKT
jgi:hypothetical protein